MWIVEKSLSEAERPTVMESNLVDIANERLMDELGSLKWRVMTKS
jgi:hypothetical protein